MAKAESGKTHLVIVESATKAKKIQNFLGPEYVVTASIGHIRDLPSGAADIPAKFKKEKWARTGVNVDDDFTPLYVVHADRKKKVRELKQQLKDADELLLATDPDREGEAIAWHLLEVLKPKVPVKRMVFHEITPDAIREAVENTRDLDMNLVEAQEARRIVDRLYGYEVSPVLWRKVMPRLSAGRVQSVATRLIVERERERMAFTSAEYWDLETLLSATDRASNSAVEFTAKLVEVDGQRIAVGRDFTDDGELKSGKSTANVVVLDKEGAQSLAAGLSLPQATLTVTSVEEKPYTRRPYAPFMTSTLQQDAANKLRFSSGRTMRIAQRLYENGYITYMRTDSTTLSKAGLAAARQEVVANFGQDYLHETPRQYARKVKNAQEAHEAIRPAGEQFASPASLRGVLDVEEFKLYELIWQRTVASQMADVKGTTMTVRLEGASATQPESQVALTASGRTITFPGFLKAYGNGTGATGKNNKNEHLPQLQEKDEAQVQEATAEGHSTNPPARYTEASLVKAMEEMGIGRPSTYASIIQTINDRGYVAKRGSALVPSWMAFAVVGLMERGFDRLVDYSYTSDMEGELDAIADGSEASTDWLNAFYFGKGDAERKKTVPGKGGLKGLVEANLENLDAREINSLHIFDDANGVPVYVRVGRYGPYLERTITSEDGADTVERANIPDDVTPDELTLAKAEELFAVPQDGRELGEHPETGYMIVAKDGRYGPYVQEKLPEEDKAKPKTASLFKSMDLKTVTLEDAVKLLSLPRLVGKDDEGTEIHALNGRYGPYIKKDKETRSLESEEELFTITVEQAEKLLAEPKRRRGQKASGPLRTLGEDPVTGKTVEVKDGRFGPYVTDGEVNASFRKADSVESMTVERASELLSARRARIAAQGGAKGGKKGRNLTRRTVKKGATRKKKS
ncbi:MAG: type I DNA topoisomerase [Lawsonella sp.]